jgi:hypothetical protein
MDGRLLSLTLRAPSSDVSPSLTVFPGELRPVTRGVDRQSMTALTAFFRALGREGRRGAFSRASIICRPRS